MSRPVIVDQLFTQTRARVYLLWAILATGGFIATHYYQRKQINAAWFSISVIGLVYMFKVMPMQVRQMKQILMAWLVPITIGMVVSGLVFYIKDDIAYKTIANLGGFWLAVMAAGYLWNGLVDRPASWYYFAVVINIVAAYLCYTNDNWRSVQYLIAAIISAWSMVNLWFFRT